MVFTSIDFAYFLPIVFFLYWFVFNRNLGIQNLFLIVASYIFYGWWDWRFLFLIAFSSMVDFLVGIGLSKTCDPFRRKLLLLTSIIVNIGFLGFFKYFNFFAQNFVNAFSFFGHPFENTLMLNIILPVGISFYTFQTLSYTIDVYKNKIKPTDSWPAFFAFVSFFPQLVAGPIERAVNLLPQFNEKRIFQYEPAVNGMRQILWGLFKKIVIADNCALYVNEIFSNYHNYSGSALAVGAVFFAFQIYGDFSGYSDIAIGTSRLFGFRLMRNFAFPYFSRDIAEFWRRWHISLSTWFRDYLYIPMGGSRGNTFTKTRNIFVIFIVSGFWHGANWTFIAWGALNALYFLPLMLMGKNRVHKDWSGSQRVLPNLKELFQMGTTFFLTTLAWIFFRAESLGQALDYIGKMMSASLFSYPNLGCEKLVIGILFFLGMEWVQRKKDHGLEFDSSHLPRPFRWGIYYGIILSCIHFGGISQEFIYFQF